MYFIRILMAKLKSYFSKAPEVTCVNCGASSKDVAMGHCRMLDRCVPSQNSELLDKTSDDTIIEAFAKGQRLFAETGRPLCFKCCEANGYVCYVCELEKAEERR